MDKTWIIGNLVKDPETRTTKNGKSLCNFTVAVNHKGADGKQGAKYYNVTAWDQCGENCAKYLAKGRKVSVVGEVSAYVYEGKDGAAKAGLGLSTNEVEFLTPKGEGQQEAPHEAKTGGGFIEVTDEDVPF